MREGEGNCLKYPKKGWERKEGRGHKDFRRGRAGRKLDRGKGALKRGAGTPLRTMTRLSFHEV